MRISDISLRNILSFGPDRAPIRFFDDNDRQASRLNIFVGPNNSGKTNIFRTITLIKDIMNRKTQNMEDYQNKLSDRGPSEIELGFQLDNEERDFLVNIMTEAVLGGIWQISDKIFNIQNSEESDKEKLIIIVARLSEKIYRAIFSNVCRVHIISDPITGSISDLHFDFGEDSTVISSRNGEIEINHADLHTVNRIISFYEFLNWLTSKSIKKSLNDLVKDGDVELDGIEIQIDDIYKLLVENLEGKGQIGITFQAINPDQFGGAESEARRYVLNLSDKIYTFLSKRLNAPKSPVYFYDSIRLLFTSSIFRLDALRGNFNRNLISRSDLQRSGFDVSNFLSTLFWLKNSDLYEERERYKKIRSEFRNLWKGIDFEISLEELSQEGEGGQTGLPYLPPKEDVNIKELGNNVQSRYSISLKIESGNSDFPLDFTSSGIIETILLLTSIYGISGKVILLDEPAQNLHPSMQQYFLESIRRNAASNENKMWPNQIFIITHSGYFINEIENVRLLKFYKEGGKFTSTIDVKNVLKNYNNGKERNKLSRDVNKSILFSKGIILVEGYTDKMVVERIDRVLSEKNQREGIVEKDWSVVQMDSKDNLDIFLEYCKSLKTPWLVITDDDSLMKDNGGRENPKNSRIAKALKPDSDLEKKIDELSKNPSDRNLVEETKKILREKYQIYVLEGKLENMLRVSDKNVESVDKVLTDIENKPDSLTDYKELVTVIEWIRNWMDRFDRTETPD
ncbi:MAG: AAA family ATPase [Nitrososphaerota archaeon]